MAGMSQNLISYIRAIAGAWRDDPRDDAQLLARFVENRDEEAFRTLMWRHGPLVWQASARVLGNSADTEDVFQTVFMAMARKASKLRANTLAGWLHRVSRQAALNAKAGMRRRQNLESHLRDTPSPKVKDNVGQSELHEVIDRELAKLPERLRVPLVLRYLEGKTQVEVAKILGCSRCAALKRLERGEVLLRERLERCGLTALSGSLATLLGAADGAPTVPPRLIDKSMQAAVAFRTGDLGGAAADAAEKLLRSLSMKALLEKSWWLVLAASVCSLGSLGAGLAIWKIFVGDSDGGNVPLAVPATITAPAPASVVARSSRVDIYGDPLPEGAIARIGSVRFRCPGTDLLGAIGGNVAERFNVALSSDGKILVSCHNARTWGGDQERVAIRFWETSTGKQLHETLLEDPGVASAPIALTPDNKQLAAATFLGKIWLIDAVTGQPVGNPLNGHWPFAYSADSKALAVRNINGPSFTLYDVGTREPIKAMPVVKRDQHSDFTFAAFSRNGRSFACVEASNPNQTTGTVHLLDVETGIERATLIGRQVTTLVFSPDSSKLATIGRDKAIRIWDAKNGREIRQLGTMAAVPSLVNFLMDGQTVLAACAGQIRRWDINTGRETQPALDCKDLLWPRLFSADGTKLIERVRDTLNIWDTATGKQIGPAAGAPQSRMETLTFSPNGKALATLEMEDSEIRLWETATGKQLGSLGSLEVIPIGGITWPSNNRIIATRRDFSGPLIVQLTKGSTGETVVETQTRPNGVKFSPDGQVLVRQRGQSLELLDVATGKNLSVVACPPIRRPVQLVIGTTLAFSADHQLLATHLIYEPTITLWEVSTGRKLYSFNLPEHSEPDLPPERQYDRLINFSPDGRLIVTQDNETKVVSLWEHVSGRLRLRLPVPPECIHADDKVAFSPDSRLLALGYLSKSKEERSIHVWDLVTEQDCQSFRGHQAGVGSAGSPRVVFSPDGRLLASAGGDYTVLIWKVRQPSAPATLSQPLDQKELQTLKTALAGADAAAAYRAIGKLWQAPEQAVALATECLQPKILTPESMQVVREVNRLVGELDSDDFQTRVKAAEELHKKLNEEVGEPIVHGILGEALLRQKLSVEVNKAITKLLDEQKKERGWGGARSPELTRMFRSIEILELIHNDAAREVLQKMVAAPPRPEVRREAEAALKRLAAHQSVLVEP